MRSLLVRGAGLSLLVLGVGCSGRGGPKDSPPLAAAPSSSADDASPDPRAAEVEIDRLESEIQGTGGAPSATSAPGPAPTRPAPR